MASVVSGGATDRIAQRIFCRIPRAGSGTRARYSSIVFGAALLFAVGLRSPDFRFFMWLMLQEAQTQVHDTSPQRRLRVGRKSFAEKQKGRVPINKLEPAPSKIKSQMPNRKLRSFGPRTEVVLLLGR